MEYLWSFDELVGTVQKKRSPPVETGGPSK